MAKNGVIEIRHDDIYLATILKDDFDVDGIQFVTTDQDTQQIGYMRRPANYIIKPHRHQSAIRQIEFTTEVLFLKKGKVRVDFYTNEQVYLKSCLLNQGDFIYLAGGGHGFKFLEESIIVEVKQGPYVGERDKVRFDPIDDNQVKFEV